MKTDASLRLFRRFQHLLQDLRYYFDLIVVQLDGFSELRQLFDEFARCCHEASKSYKGPHDLDVDSRRSGRPQYT